VAKTRLTQLVDHSALNQNAHATDLKNSCALRCAWKAVSVLMDTFEIHLETVFNWINVQPLLALLISTSQTVALHVCQLA
jgi:hypothetical protein